MLPGVNTAMLKQVKVDDPKRMKHVEAIVLSMTPEGAEEPGDHQRLAAARGSPRARAGRSAR